MISCKLAGGLGNYLFQIAATHCLAIKNGDAAIFDLGNSMQIHKNINTYATNILRNIEAGNHQILSRYTESGFAYNEIPYTPNLELNGYFQSEKYMIRAEVLKLYELDSDTKNYILDRYGDEFDGTASLHIRRGDYVNKQDKHPILGMEYYNLAMKYLEKCQKFYIFSDDIEWCMQHFHGDKYVFIKDEDYIELWLMSLCEHNIIANSSFSWWGAWLNQNKNKKVIAPKNWFGPRKNLNTADLYCKDWLLI